MGYDAHGVRSMVTPLSSDSLRAALMGALERSWPGGVLPGEPREYDAGDEPAVLADTLMAARSKGLVPLLVTVTIGRPEDAGDRLMRFLTVAARDGVWLHADIVTKAAFDLERIERADSVAFRVPTPAGVRVGFATRHPRILDEAFSRALGITSE